MQIILFRFEHIKIIKGLYLLVFMQFKLELDSVINHKNAI